MRPLEKNWVVGFIDGDGSFALDKVDNFYKPSLSISQNDPQLLYKIKDYFGCGTVTLKSISKSNIESWHYRCRSTKQFQELIIPKLGKAPFQTIKQVQYELICDKAIPLLINPLQSNLSERDRLVALIQIDEQIKASRNDSTYVNSNEPLDLMWFLGFFEAEGNYYFAVRNTDPVKLSISFKVTQKNKPLLDKIQGFFGFGKVDSEGYERTIWNYNVSGIKNIGNAFPIFKTYPLKGKKNVERIKFLKAIRIILSEGHKTENGLAKLQKLEADIKRAL